MMLRSGFTVNMNRFISGAKAAGSVCGINGAEAAGSMMESGLAGLKPPAPMWNISGIGGFSPELLWEKKTI